MVTLHVVLPEPLQSFVEKQVADGGFANPSEYMQTLIQDAYHAQQKSAMEAKLLEGIDALERGEASEMTPKDWERLRSEHLERQRKHNGS